MHSTCILQRVNLLSCAMAGRPAGKWAMLSPPLPLLLLRSLHSVCAPYWMPTICWAQLLDNQSSCAQQLHVHSSLTAIDLLRGLT